jgi:hypothetical protein
MIEECSDKSISGDGTVEQSQASAAGTGIITLFHVFFVALGNTPIAAVEISASTQLLLCSLRCVLSS